MIVDADERFMDRALKLAEQARALEEVPVGCVVVAGGEIIGEGFNRPVSSHDPSAHAEIVALRDAAARTENYRLTDATLYVTLEPCCMCAGAILQARVDRVVYAADDRAAGAVQSNFGLLDAPELNHRCAFKSGVRKDEASALLQAFFAERR